MRITLSRLKEIHRRQDPPRWSPNYEPTIKATREEAPSRSRCAQVWSERLGRYCHVLSSIEQKALIFALFHPGLFELHEQRVLSTEAREHPLANHPLMQGEVLPNVTGTIALCDQLSCLELHPVFKTRHPETLEPITVPIPWTGDLLLFIQDEAGPYCVNWSVKATSRDFQQNAFKAKPSIQPDADRHRVRTRHAIEELYYQNIGIPTIHVTDAELPARLIHNLRSFLLFLPYTKDVEPEVYEEICDRLRFGQLVQQPPLEVLLTVVHKHGITMEQARACFMRALWHRDVIAELMDEPIFLDRALLKQRRDPLKEYARWFSRVTV